MQYFVTCKYRDILILVGKAGELLAKVSIMEEECLLCILRKKAKDGKENIVSHKNSDSGGASV